MKRGLQTWQNAQIQIHPTRVNWATPSEKGPSNMAKCTDSDSSHVCAKSHPGICSPLIHSMVSNNSVSRQRRLWSGCAVWSGPLQSAYAWQFHIAISPISYQKTSMQLMSIRDKNKPLYKPNVSASNTSKSSHRLMKETIWKCYWINLQPYLFVCVGVLQPCQQCYEHMELVI